jgi:hypothetical protein
MTKHEWQQLAEVEHIIELEETFSNDPVDAKLLSDAIYINDKSLGTIDVFSILRKAYEKGVRDALGCL